MQGSTSGNIAVALSALRPGEPVLVQRNAHKSVLAGLVQVGARPVWLEPRWDPRFGIAHGLDADVVEKALASKSSQGVVGTAPHVLRHHRRHRVRWPMCAGGPGTRLLVDGAHSPHFAFHPELAIARRSGPVRWPPCNRSTRSCQA